MIDTSNESDRKMEKKNIRSFLKSLTPGDRVWLRDGMLKQIQARKWIFSRERRRDGVSYASSQNIGVARFVKYNRHGF
jgi:hypothetical protein